MFGLKNSAGYSLVEILIGVALMGGIALTGAQIFKQQNQGVKYHQLVAELDTYHSNLRRILQDVNNCNATYGIENLHDPINIGALTSAINICCPSGTAPCSIDPLTNPCSRMVNQQLALNTNVMAYAKIGQKILNDAFTIVSWEFKDYSTGNNVPSIQNTFSGAIMKRVDLRIRYKMNRSLPGPKDFIRVIPIGFRFTSAKFQGCITQESSAKNSLVREVCECLNAQTSTIKLATWYGGEAIERCEWFDTSGTHTCPNGQVLLGINSLGDKVCTPASYQLNEGDMLFMNEASCPTGTVPKLLQNGSQVYVGCSP